MNLYKKIKALIKPESKPKIYEATIIWPDGQLFKVKGPTFEYCFNYLEDLKIDNPQIIGWID